ncbi:NAD(P)H-binding protein [Novosphingobium mangrovi (ex Huang et al. 2023)]|uniref:NAD(P)H-binding protein n=1 Tax=Novosphingobium mangrovi (ex Huang et al. 2023) TaxID=2976432 RepID=A0ABT2I3P0_9SPHN|nr:NAD(P)H-binding protein [Novosphingobium mangrovi (ex Huang et al. 2023)]MCT2399421.1 NAD(P)H-binding protein [Novosphingobium mangrovi (ex Huang et al. 2023)]
MTSRQLRICLVGATGMVGGTLIAEAVGRTDVRLVGVARREAHLPPGARMEMLVGEPIDWPNLIAAARADVLVCALGTTIKAAGSQEAFRAVDHDLVRFCAEAARAAGIEHMIVVSSTGAARASRNFYLSVKGETEDALGKLGFRRLDILRPGLLRGHREERRTLEAAAQIMAPLADWVFLHGKYRRYRSVSARKLAQAILALAYEKAGGRFVHDYDAMRRVLRRSGD